MSTSQTMPMRLGRAMRTSASKPRRLTAARGSGSLADQGKPYDPLMQEAPDVSLPAEKRKIGGLGIFMARKNMDDMTYEYRDGRNILTMFKRI